MARREVSLVPQHRLPTGRFHRRVMTLAGVGGNARVLRQQQCNEFVIRVSIH